MSANTPTGRSTHPGTSRCPACNAAVPGGLEGCQALWDTLAARVYSDLRYAPYQVVAFDTYCMQHVERYGRSAKSYAAHLARLCCGLEYAGEAHVYSAIQQWLNGKVKLEKPSILPFLGELTIVDVQAAETPAEYARLVKSWAQSTWQAYASQHNLARTWVQEALNHSANPDHLRYNRTL